MPTSAILRILPALLVVAAPAAADGFSGLTGKELSPAGDATVGSVVGALLGQTATLAVRVVDDAATRLAVEVTYSGLAGRQLQGELRDGNRQPQAALGRPTVSLVDAAGTVVLVFEPGAGLAEGSELESATLRLRVLRTDLPVPEMERGFALGKRWRVPVAPQNVVVRITPRPLGAAAQLRDEPGGAQSPALPPLLVRPAGKANAPQRGRTATSGATNRSMTVLPGATAPSTASPSGATIKRPVALGAAQQTAVSALGRDSRLVAVSQFTFGLGRQVTDKQGKGPGTATFDLLEGLRADVALERGEILRVGSDVFQDQNPASGLFYFVPASYGLSWSGIEGYGMRMLYGAAAPGSGGAPGSDGSDGSTAGSGAGEVLMAARLAAGVDPAEVELARALLRAYQARHTSLKLTELRSLPIDAPPALSLAGDLQKQFQIPADRVAVSAISDALGAIEVSWTTDAITKENVQLALVEEVGVNGTLALTPSGGGLAPWSVPVRLRLAASETFGRQPWRRAEPWRNVTPYPVRLRYLHALVLTGNVPVVYSWSLDDTTVPPQARTEFDAARVPRWIDARAARTWLDYVPVEDCAPCDQQVIAAISGGVTTLGSAQIAVRTITPLADFGAHEITLTVRSRYFEAGSTALRTRAPLPLDGDNKDFTIGPLFLGERQPGESVPGDPLYWYQLEVTMPDGTTHRGTTWIPGDSLRLLIGKVQVEQAVGSLAAGAPE